MRRIEFEALPPSSASANVQVLLRGDGSVHTQVTISIQKVYISRATEQQRLRMSFKGVSSNGELELRRRAEASEPSPELDIAAPIPTKPFPFLQLPREIRDLICYFALTRPLTPLTISPENIYCYSGSDVCIGKNQAPLWDKAKPYRLFRVNRQFGAEALEVLYSKFPIQFTHPLQTPLINIALRDNISLKHKSLVKSVGFTIGVTTIENSWYIHQGEEIRHEVEDVLKWLPNLRRVDLAFKLDSRVPRESEVKNVVDRLVQILSPLRNVAGVTLHRGSSARIDQLLHIVMEVRKALGCCEQFKLCPRTDCSLAGMRLPMRL